MIFFTEKSKVFFVVVVVVGWPFILTIVYRKLKCTFIVYGKVTRKIFCY